MGRHALIEKLGQQFRSKAEFTEPLVVYLMVGIRKLLELENSYSEYPGLKFHCDWTLHSKLDKKGAIEVIKRFDELEELKREDGGVSQDCVSKLEEAFGVEVLRTSLCRFLKDHALPDNITTDEVVWNSFLRTYGGIIENVPLEFTLTPVRHISKVVVSKADTPEPRQSAANPFLFALEWQPTRFDGKPVKSYRINFHASPVTADI